MAFVSVASVMKELTPDPFANFLESLQRFGDSGLLRRIMAPTSSAGQTELATNKDAVDESLLVPLIATYCCALSWYPAEKGGTCLGRNPGCSGKSEVTCIKAQCCCQVRAQATQITRLHSAISDHGDRKRNRLPSLLPLTVTLCHPAAFVTARGRAVHMLHEQ